MRITKLIPFLIAVLVGFTGCAPIYSTKSYEPGSPEGRVAFEKARKDIYPQQVRQNPAKYGDEEIAWAGIVKKTELFESRYGPAVGVLVEHHYFDWLEDHGAQSEVFFLSPRGEGDFMIFLQPRETLTEKSLTKLIPNGTMVVAVGKIHIESAKDKSKPLALLIDYHQFIDQKWYRTDIYDYGRENEPITKVRENK